MPTYCWLIQGQAKLDLIFSLKFRFSEKATKFKEPFHLNLKLLMFISLVVYYCIQIGIFHFFVAFSENLNFIHTISECYSQIQIIVLHCCRSHNRRSRLVYSAWPCSISNGLASRDAKWTWIPWDRVLLNVNWVKKFSTAVLKIRLDRYLVKVITEFIIFYE